MPPSAKRPSDDVFDRPLASKYARTSGNGDLTGSARRKSGAQTRTGQACDRCKVRKIRCDARPGGCSPCLQNNTECRTTDRITGRATSRGYTESLETENTNLKMYVLELQAQLRQNGVEPGPAPQPLPNYTHMQNLYSPATGGYDHSSQAERHSTGASLLPEFRSGCIGDNYLGVLPENDSLSPIEGTSLHLFGTKVDIAEFMPADSPDTSAMSYQTFLKHAFGGSHPTKAPDLPSYEDFKVFAEWYFRSVQNFVPILHKPDFMNLLYQIYHQNHQTSTAETVMVHMVLAVMNFQWASRNGNLEARAMSFKHYHYALTFIPKLITNHKVEDVQALTLICSQLRNQPCPGAAWMFTNVVFGIAVESGLHRSASSWPSSSAIEQDVHTIEMRKRIFWSLLTFHVCLSGKLGRPMPIRLEDFDIEMPNEVDDGLPGEAHTTKWRKCSFRAAIQGFKLLRIIMQVYSTIYSIRSAPAAYEANMRQLEQDLLAFQRQIPPELSGGPQTTEEDRMCALYLQLAIAECELLLHHPSLCRSSSPRIMSNNLDVCLAASSKFLNAAVQLKQLKSLDTTWYYATNFLAAIFTTLFAFTTEKKDQLSSSDLTRLRADMDSWLEVLGEVGSLLGSGTRLQEAVSDCSD
ncbi:MAG: hypothetical protein FE78DRAFT_429001 [Acidomyces sp. 'richmondensis']|nr:MAG: hypothetical protein FE78DRAFT_429001 [Acidomyces sp. 'richmondensis']